ncbi:UPF0728 protein-like [Watersipora subatra]|uniref:UPF0728 protein-like n=1 Tax=Watersipora subatra TaxID=2589382 RepID=UPI00355C583E
MDGSKKHVSVLYGPYSSCGVVTHRTDRLDGLQTLLKSNGHKVDLNEMADRNSVQLWVKGELVYQCSITDLEFGGDGLMDPLCSEALKAVDRAF